MLYLPKAVGLLYLSRDCRKIGKSKEWYRRPTPHIIAWTVEPLCSLGDSVGVVHYKSQMPPRKMPRDGIQTHALLAIPFGRPRPSKNGVGTGFGYFDCTRLSVDGGVTRSQPVRRSPWTLARHASGSNDVWLGINCDNRC
jgi:hypothetical protein